MKTIVFDVDGTLTDTAHLTKEVYRQLIIEELGKTLSLEEVAAGISGPTVQVLQNFGFTDIPEAMQKYHAILLRTFRSAGLFNGIMETLEVLKKSGALLGVVTARNNKELCGDAVFSGIRDLFDCIISADDTTRFKPNPDPLLLCLEKLDAQPADALYVGDMRSDYLCAKAAGVSFGLALWGAETREGISAQHYLGKPEEILELLD